MAESIQITVNGESRFLECPLPLTTLLRELKIELSYVAIAINEEILPHSEKAQKIVQAGDRIEIIRAVSGG
ncbi:MAG: sulfur carrier protein ThiS [Deltaproteobacteria bacterium]|nr:sulfur carrier protein ThiS [Deltaproteobacteria bacterium]